MPVLHLKRITRLWKRFGSNLKKSYTTAASIKIISIKNQITILKKNEPNGRKTAKLNTAIYKRLSLKNNPLKNKVKKSFPASSEWSEEMLSKNLFTFAFRSKCRMKKSWNKRPIENQYSHSNRLRSFKWSYHGAKFEMKRKKSVKNIYSRQTTETYPIDCRR